MALRCNPDPCRRPPVPNPDSLGGRLRPPVRMQRKTPMDAAGTLEVATTWAAVEGHSWWTRPLASP